MLLSIYALYDVITEEYGNLMLAKTEGHMKRILKDNLKTAENALEYELWCFGTFDTEKGVLQPSERPNRVQISLPSDVESSSLQEKREEIQRIKKHYEREGSVL